MFLGSLLRFVVYWTVIHGQRLYMMRLIICIFLFMWHKSVAHDVSGFLVTNDLSDFDEYLQHMRVLLSEILISARPKHCLGIITDNIYHPVYNQQFFERLEQQPLLYYYIKVNSSEDLLSPNYQTVRILKHMHAHKCDKYLIILANGNQVARLLKFLHRHSLIDTSKNFVFLYDSRLFKSDMLNIWAQMISNIYLKRNDYQNYDILSLCYTQVLHNELILQKLRSWTYKQRLKYTKLFSEQKLNLKGVLFPIAVLEHVPMVIRKNNTDNKYIGVEVEIVKALGRALNFKPVFYETTDSKKERWGRVLPNGTYTGLIGQLTNHSARIAIGNIQLLKFYSSIFDRSLPHSQQCLTFLTPESAENNAWRTLILPFNADMWAGVIVSLFFVGSLFYFMSLLHALLLRRSTAARAQFLKLFKKFQKAKIHTVPMFSMRILHSHRFRNYINHVHIPTNEEDLFDNYANCLLLTYSMLLYVSLPRMPRNWPLRMLTGWYWIYCILLTVTYRASFTAILANPAPRITVNSLEELAESGIIATAWGTENKLFFDRAFDKIAHEIGKTMEIIDNIEEVTLNIAQGSHAYYDNLFFLRHLRQKSSQRAGSEEEVLHIMQQCVVNMPIALGLEKNSPLKSHIDKYLTRLSESGLIDKWLKDATAHLPAEEQMPREALIDLEKFWSSFVALGVGFFFAACAVVCELLYFKRVVREHPLYDKYNLGLYYKFKRRFPNAKTNPNFIE